MTGAENVVTLIVAVVTVITLVGVILTRQTHWESRHGYRPDGTPARSAEEQDERVRQRWL